MACWQLGVLTVDTVAYRVAAARVRIHLCRRNRLVLVALVQRREHLRSKQAAVDD